MAHTKKGQIIAMKYFIYCKSQYSKSQAVFAIAQLLALDPECFIFPQAGQHILKVVETNSIVVTPVCEIKEKLFFGFGFSGGLKFVIRMPN